jgi:hypothetical protein
MSKYARLLEILKITVAGNICINRQILVIQRVDKKAGFSNQYDVTFELQQL